MNAGVRDTGTGCAKKEEVEEKTRAKAAVLMRLILVDTNADMVAAWRAESAFAQDKQNVHIVQGCFSELKAPYDCFVSPGNGFGLMDGGIDRALCGRFGDQLMVTVQKAIIEEWKGEQPVGSCLLVPTGDAQHPWLAHAPTVRVPTDVSQTQNAYSALWAVLNAVHRHNRQVEAMKLKQTTAGVAQISVLACPGLCSMVGEMSPKESARQMAVAWHYFHHPPHDPRVQMRSQSSEENHLINWATASARHQTIENLAPWWTNLAVTRPSSSSLLSSSSCRASAP
jgi:O-acetyl-ADP-ribose deacetylase (regulator of RNase III)